MSSKCHKITFGGISVAICMLCLLAAAAIPSLSMLLPLGAGLMIGAVAIEVDTKWAMLTFFAASLMGLLICPDLSVMIAFVLFFGYYPILHISISKIKVKLIRTICKLAAFNIAFGVWFAIMSALIPTFLLPEGLEAIKQYVILGIIVIANVFFLSYNTIIEAIQEYYVNNFRRLLLNLPPINSAETEN